MIILPAIDILDNAPVRLYQGDYAQSETVGESIMEIAKAFEEQGAQYLHMVDLNGAKEGKKVNQETILQVAKALRIPVEVGGGIRCMADVESYLSQGVSRVILGTSAIEDETFLKEAVANYQEKIAVGIDCKDGYVCGRGWLSESKWHFVDFAKHMETLGVQTIIVTDISKDGTMMGPNLDMLQELRDACGISIIASGGIKDLSHIQALKELNLYGAITGKAMYAGTLSLHDAIQLCKEEA